MDEALRHARRVVVSVIGGTVLLLGLILIPLPGPGLVVSAMGLAILGIEFAWARRYLRRMKEKMGVENPRETRRVPLDRIPGGP